MIDPSVRLADCADGDDIAQLELLERDARNTVASQRGGERWLVEHEAVAGAWVDQCESADVWVAVIGDVVVGYLVAILGADHIVRVDQVWVAPEARELGFGDELLAHAISRAQSAGAVAVEGQALPGDRHTKNLYERAGIVARLITTYRVLDDVSDPANSAAASR